MFNDYRISTHKQYFVIAKEHKAIYEEKDRLIRDAESLSVAEEELGDTLESVFDLYEVREKSAAIAITFAAMCLEAFLYDYAAAKLGDKYVLSHLDKLDMVSKILVYPRLVCGKEIDKSTSVYGDIKILQQRRNDLVHFKSKRFDLYKMHDASDFHTMLNKRNKQGVDICIRAIESFVKVLDQFHGKNNYFYNSVCVW